MYPIAHDLDPQQAQDAKRDLLAAIDGIGTIDPPRFALDLTEGAPTQIALQLGFAAIAELRARQIEPAPGPVLSVELALQVHAATKNGGSA